MEGFDIYNDIAVRTQGDIYAGVVGPVRTGKSTFIKRFMELLVLPNIENKYKKRKSKGWTAFKWCREDHNDYRTKICA